MFKSFNHTGKCDKLSSEFLDPHLLIVMNYSLERHLFPDTFQIVIIQIENHDCNSEASSCQSLTAKFTFLYVKIPKNLAPNVHHWSLSKYIFTCLPLLSKLGRKTFIHIHDSSNHGQYKMQSLNASFKLITLPETTEAKMQSFNSCLLFYITTSWYKKLKPRTKKSMHKFGRALLFINKMAQPQQNRTQTTDHMACLLY